MGNLINADEFSETSPYIYYFTITVPIVMLAVLRYLERSYIFSRGIRFLDLNDLKKEGVSPVIFLN